MDLERYPSTLFGEVRRTIGRHGHVAYFPAPIPRRLDLPTSTVPLLADAEASLGRLAGVGQLLPDPKLLIRPYLLREALSSTRIEGTQATMAEMFEVDAAREASNPDVEEMLNYIDAREWGLSQLERMPLSTRLLRDIHRRLMAGVRGRARTPGELRTSQNWIGAASSTTATADFVPPPPGELAALMTDWERFANEEIELPVLIQSALLHPQFETIHPFLDGNGLAGARDRLAILAESDVGPALDPATGGVQIDLRDALDQADVVLFRLEADRRPLAAAMVGAAIIQDLVAIDDERQHGEQRPGLVIIDEYSALGAPQVGRLFGRGRGARLSQVLGTQELGELGSIDPNAVGGGGSLLNQTGGNLEVLMAGRQNMPASAEMIVAIAGTRGAWITTQQTHTPAAGLLTGLGSRSRGREYVIHPDTIKSLDVGELVVIEPRRRRAAVVRVFHPNQLRRRGVEC
jgi:fido (protein-threonine AMPylation protein)